MAKELAFALINPYTISKSRTGGVIGRFIARTGLDFVAARMFGPSEELTTRYADLLRNNKLIDEDIRKILSDYVGRSFGPDPITGRRRRVMMLLFEGEDAVQRVKNVTGDIRYTMASADTIRDTYGDYILDESGTVRYFEPAVLIAPNAKSAAGTLKLWAEYSKSDGGLIDSAADLPGEGEVQQRTLVLIKPDNFQFPSARPGNIIDIFSCSGLRIIGSKVHRMSMTEAENFYGPVRDILREKLKGKAADRASNSLAAEFGMEIPEEVTAQLGEILGPLYGEDQFYRIIQFMTGCWVPGCTPEEKQLQGKHRCLALVYAGVNAVNKIRNILGPTDPSKAQHGQVRREFGRDIMVNAAHASDSTENAERELKIVRVDEDDISDWVQKYYP